MNSSSEDDDVTVSVSQLRKYLEPRTFHRRHARSPAESVASVASGRQATGEPSGGGNRASAGRASRWGSSRATSDAGAGRIRTPSSVSAQPVGLEKLSPGAWRLAAEAKSAARTNSSSDDDDERLHLNAALLSQALRQRRATTTSQANSLRTVTSSGSGTTARRGLDNAMAAPPIDGHMGFAEHSQGSWPPVGLGNGAVAIPIGQPDATARTVAVQLVYDSAGQPLYLSPTRHSPVAAQQPHPVQLVPVHHLQQYGSAPVPAPLPQMLPVPVVLAQVPGPASSLVPAQPQLQSSSSWSPNSAPSGPSGFQLLQHQVVQRDPEPARAGLLSSPSAPSPGDAYALARPGGTPAAQLLAAPYEAAAVANSQVHQKYTVPLASSPPVQVDAVAARTGRSESPGKRRLAELDSGCPGTSRRLSRSPSLEATSTSMPYSGVAGRAGIDGSASAAPDGMAVAAGLCQPQMLQAPTSQQEQARRLADASAGHLPAFTADGYQEPSSARPIAMAADHILRAEAPLSSEPTGNAGSAPHSWASSMHEPPAPGRELAVLQQPEASSHDASLSTWRRSAADPQVEAPAAASLGVATAASARDHPATSTTAATGWLEGHETDRTLAKDQAERFACVQETGPVDRAVTTSALSTEGVDVQGTAVARPRSPRPTAAVAARKAGTGTSAAKRLEGFAEAWSQLQQRLAEAASHQASRLSKEPSYRVRAALKGVEQPPSAAAASAPPTGTAPGSHPPELPAQQLGTRLSEDATAAAAEADRPQTAPAQFSFPVQDGEPGGTSVLASRPLSADATARATRDSGAIPNRLARSSPAQPSAHDNSDIRWAVPAHAAPSQASAPASPRQSQLAAAGASFSTWGKMPVKPQVAAAASASVTPPVSSQLQRPGADRSSPEHSRPLGTVLVLDAVRGTPTDIKAGAAAAQRLQSPPASPGASRLLQPVAAPATSAASQAPVSAVPSTGLLHAPHFIAAAAEGAPASKPQRQGRYAPTSASSTLQPAGLLPDGSSGQGSPRRRPLPASPPTGAGPASSPTTAVAVTGVYQPTSFSVSFNQQLPLDGGSGLVSAPLRLDAGMSPGRQRSAAEQAARAGGYPVSASPSRSNLSDLASITAQLDQLLRQVHAIGGAEGAMKGRQSPVTTSADERAAMLPASPAAVTRVVSPGRAVQGASKIPQLLQANRSSPRATSPGAANAPSASPARLRQLTAMQLDLNTLRAVGPMHPQSAARPAALSPEVAAKLGLRTGSPKQTSPWSSSNSTTSTRASSLSLVQRPSDATGRHVRGSRAASPPPVSGAPSAAGAAAVASRLPASGTAAMGLRTPLAPAPRVVARIEPLALERGSQHPSVPPASFGLPLSGSGLRQEHHAATAVLAGPVLSWPADTLRFGLAGNAAGSAAAVLSDRPRSNPSRYMHPKPGRYGRYRGFGLGGDRSAGGASDEISCGSGGGGIVDVRSSRSLSVGGALPTPGLGGQHALYTCFPEPRISGGGRISDRSWSFSFGGLDSPRSSLQLRPHHNTVPRQSELRSQGGRAAQGSLAQPSAAGLGGVEASVRGQGAAPSFRDMQRSPSPDLRQPRTSLGASRQPKVQSPPASPVASPSVVRTLWLSPAAPTGGASQPSTPRVPRLSAPGNNYVFQTPSNKIKAAAAAAPSPVTGLVTGTMRGRSLVVTDSPSPRRSTCASRSPSPQPAQVHAIQSLPTKLASSGDRYVSAIVAARLLTNTVTVAASARGVNDGSAARTGGGALALALDSAVVRVSSAGSRRSTVVDRGSPRGGQPSAPTGRPFTATHIHPHQLAGHSVGRAASPISMPVAAAYLRPATVTSALPAASRDPSPLRGSTGASGQASSSPRNLADLRQSSPSRAVSGPGPLQAHPSAHQPNMRQSPRTLSSSSAASTAVDGGARTLERVLQSLATVHHPGALSRETGAVRSLQTAAATGASGGASARLQTASTGGTTRPRVGGSSVAAPLAQFSGQRAMLQQPLATVTSGLLTVAAATGAVQVAAGGRRTIAPLTTAEVLSFVTEYSGRRSSSPTSATIPQHAGLSMSSPRDYSQAGHCKLQLPDAMVGGESGGKAGPSAAVPADSNIAALTDPASTAGRPAERELGSLRRSLQLLLESLRVSTRGHQQRQSVQSGSTKGRSGRTSSDEGGHNTVAMAAGGENGVGDAAAAEPTTGTMDVVVAEAGSGNSRGTEPSSSAWHSSLQRQTLTTCCMIPLGRQPADDIRVALPVARLGPDGAGAVPARTALPRPHPEEVACSTGAVQLEASPAADPATMVVSDDPDIGHDEQASLVVVPADIGNAPASPERASQAGASASCVADSRPVLDLQYARKGFGGDGDGSRCERGSPATAAGDEVSQQAEAPSELLPSVMASVEEATINLPDADVAEALPSVHRAPSDLSVADGASPSPPASSTASADPRVLGRSCCGSGEAVRQPCAAVRDSMLGPYAAAQPPCGSGALDLQPAAAPPMAVTTSAVHRASTCSVRSSASSGGCPAVETAPTCNAASSGLLSNQQQETASASMDRLPVVVAVQDLPASEGAPVEPVAERYGYLADSASNTAARMGNVNRCSRASSATSVSPCAASASRPQAGPQAVPCASQRSNHAVCGSHSSSSNAASSRGSDDAQDRDDDGHAEVSSTGSASASMGSCNGVTSPAQAADSDRLRGANPHRGRCGRGVVPFPLLRCVVEGSPLASVSSAAHLAQWMSTPHGAAGQLSCRPGQVCPGRQAALRHSPRRQPQFDARLDCSSSSGSAASTNLGARESGEDRRLLRGDGETSAESFAQQNRAGGKCGLRMQQGASTSDSVTASCEHSVCSSAENSSQEDGGGSIQRASLAPEAAAGAASAERVCTVAAAEADMPLVVVGLAELSLHRASARDSELGFGPEVHGTLSPSSGARSAKSASPGADSANGLLSTSGSYGSCGHGSPSQAVSCRSLQESVQISLQLQGAVAGSEEALSPEPEQDVSPDLRRRRLTRGSPHRHYAHIYPVGEGSDAASWELSMAVGTSFPATTGSGCGLAAKTPAQVPVVSTQEPLPQLDSRSGGVERAPDQPCNCAPGLDAGMASIASGSAPEQDPSAAAKPEHHTQGSPTLRTSPTPLAPCQSSPSRPWATSTPADELATPDANCAVVQTRTPASGATQASTGCPGSSRMTHGPSRYAAVQDSPESPPRRRRWEQQQQREACSLEGSSSGTAGCSQRRSSGSSRSRDGDAAILQGAGLAGPVAVARPEPDPPAASFSRQSLAAATVLDPGSNGPSVSTPLEPTRAVDGPLRSTAAHGPGSSTRKQLLDPVKGDATVAGHRCVGILFDPRTQRKHGHPPEQQQKGPLAQARHEDVGTGSLPAPNTAGGAYLGPAVNQLRHRSPSAAPRAQELLSQSHPTDPQTLAATRRPPPQARVQPTSVLLQLPARQAKPQAPSQQAPVRGVLTQSLLRAALPQHDARAVPLTIVPRPLGQREPAPMSAQKAESFSPPDYPYHPHHRHSAPAAPPGSPAPVVVIPPRLSSTLVGPLTSAAAGPAAGLGSVANVRDAGRLGVPGVGLGVTAARTRIANQESSRPAAAMGVGGAAGKSLWTEAPMEPVRGAASPASALRVGKEDVWRGELTASVAAGKTVHQPQLLTRQQPGAARQRGVQGVVMTGVAAPGGNYGWGGGAYERAVAGGRQGLHAPVVQRRASTVLMASLRQMNAATQDTCARLLEQYHREGNHV